MNKSIHMTKTARVVISPYLLKQLLGLPVDADILDVSLTHDPYNVTIIVRHQDLPEVLEGSRLAKVEYAATTEIRPVFIQWVCS